MNNVYFHVTDLDSRAVFVFTTTDREVAACLELICNESNTTEERVMAHITLSRLDL